MLALAVFAAVSAQDARFFTDPVGYVTSLEQEVRLLRSHGSAPCPAREACPQQACPACPICAEPLDDTPQDAHQLALELQVCTAQLQQTQRSAQAAVQAQDDTTSAANTAKAQVQSLQAANEALEERLRTAESGARAQAAEQDWEQEQTLTQQWKAEVEKLQAEKASEDVELQLAKSQNGNAASEREAAANETRALNASLQVANRVNVQLQQLLKAAADREGALEQQVAAAQPTATTLSSRADALEGTVQKLQLANAELADESSRETSELADKEAEEKGLAAKQQAVQRAAEAAASALQEEHKKLRSQLDSAKAEVNRLQQRVDAAEATAQEAKASVESEARAAERARVSEAEAVKRLVVARQQIEKVEKGTKVEAAARQVAESKVAEAESRMVEAERKTNRFQAAVKEEQELVSTANRRAKAAEKRRAQMQAEEEQQAQNFASEKAALKKAYAPPRAQGFGARKVDPLADAPTTASNKVTTKPVTAGLLARRVKETQAAILDAQEGEGPTSADDDVEADNSEVDDLVDEE
jgi:hypothetical protein